MRKLFVWNVKTPDVISQLQHCFLLVSAIFFSFFSGWPDLAAKPDLSMKSVLDVLFYSLHIYILRLCATVSVTTVLGVPDKMI